MKSAERNHLIDRIEALEQEVANLRKQLNRCFKGEMISVRNELILEALQQQTDELLKMPQEDLKEYLERRYDV